MSTSTSGALAACLVGLRLQQGWVHERSIGNLSSREAARRFDAELARLRGDGVLDEAQAHAVTEALATAMRQAERRSSRRWVEILAYLTLLAWRRMFTEAW